MSERVVHLKCDHCHAEAEGEDAELADGVWIHILHEGQELNYCDFDCLIADLPERKEE